MVFPGHFSTGCMQCRKRKVKCDEGKPTCRRCYIYGKPCPGYTDQFHFRRGLSRQASDTQSSKSSSVSPMQQRCIDDDARAQSQEHASNSDRQLIARARATRDAAIILNPDVSQDNRSLCYFIRRFVSPWGVDSFPGHLKFLPELFDNCGRGPLELATLSVAQLAAYNQFSSNEYRLRSYQNYGRAVRNLQQIIKNEDTALNDNVIATVLLLCTYKDISGDGSGDPSEHAAGLFYLLEKRGVEQLATQRGVELFVFGLLRLQVYSFLHDDDRYCDPGGIATMSGTFDPLMRALSMMSKVLRLRHALSKSIAEFMNAQQAQEARTFAGYHDRRQMPGPAADAATIPQCFAAIEEFDKWDIEAPSYWKNIFEDRTMPAALGQVATAATHYDTETACVIVLIRSARLILLLSLLEYFDRMQEITGGHYGKFGGGAAWSDCVSAMERDIRSSISDMLACVPYVLGELDSSGRLSSISHDGAGALVILQSIRLITYCRWATEEQIRAGQHILSRINAAIGIRSAISWAQELANDSELASSPGLVGPHTSPLSLRSSSTSPSQGSSVS